MGGWDPMICVWGQHPFSEGGTKVGAAHPTRLEEGMGSPGMGRNGGLCFCGVAGGLGGQDGVGGVAVSAWVV